MNKSLSLLKNLSLPQNKIGIVINRVQQSDLGFGFLQTGASGQCASLSFGFLHRITVLPGNFAYNVGHIYTKGQKIISI
jgi:hypothetical protein